MKDHLKAKAFGITRIGNHGLGYSKQQENEHFKPGDTVRLNGCSNVMRNGNYIVGSTGVVDW